MKYLSIIALSFTLLSLEACLNCRRVDCQGNGFRNIRYLSQADSTDLILTKTYSLDSLTITPLLFNETQLKPGANAFETDNDYIIQVIVNENTRGFVFQLQDLPPDTLLTVTWRRGPDECCSAITDIDVAILNGDTLSPFDSEILLFK
jgi:hypothetical protein